MIAIAQRGLLETGTYTLQCEYDTESYKDEHIVVRGLSIIDGKKYAVSLPITDSMFSQLEDTEPFQLTFTVEE